MSAEREPRRGHWYLLTGLLIGLTLGLLIAWVISPVQYVDTAPASLHADFKDQYRSMIASAYLATGELGRAQSRLSLLGDADPRQTLTLQAQHALSVGDPSGSAYALARLADALIQPPVGGQIPDEIGASPTATTTATVTKAETSSVTRAPTRRPTGTLTPLNTPTPRPTRTPTPTLGAAFVLVAQENVCDVNLSEGLLQVEIQDAAGQPIPGAEVIITWEGGDRVGAAQEHFFTGLKPELGNGYADFVMQPEVGYSLRLAAGGRPVSNLIAPNCRTSGGDSYYGGVRLLFQQP
ncbi:MAG: hypothetical protein QMD04_09965 [Anaerolineales bacterium]|nr:hypothetical protein [Anaerolineales bacterium]